jgi:2-oxoglutarate ferredoxin oxidoreductase subunit beta
MTEQTKEKKVVYSKPKSAFDTPSLFCPGCHHSLIARVVCEAIDELGIQKDAVGVSGVGCHGMCHVYMDVDFVFALHGRAPGTATGIKRGLSNKGVVFTFQGDGDLASIGLGDILSAVNRGEKLTTIFFNNAGYGTTGGQMAPTTLEGQVTPTTPEGRDPSQHGHPVHMAELMASLRGVAFSARVALTDLKNFVKAKKAVKKAFQKQMDNVGYGFVEFVCTCPPSWGMNPAKSMEWLQKAMLEEYPIGELKNVDRIE